MKNAKSYPQLIARLSLGIGLIFPVMDRFGLRGAPGTKGVNWGNWENFVNYTNYILPIFNHGLSNLMGIFVTVAEIAFGIGLVLGWKTKFMAWGTAILTICFGLCMATFLGLSSPFAYPVFVFTGAALLLACSEEYRWSIDELNGK